jgi:hypothetical protein
VRQLDKQPLAFVIISASLFGVSPPLAKLLVRDIPPVALAGSSRTGAFFSLAPFIAALTSLIILREWIGWVMFPATGFMIIGVWLIVSEVHSHLYHHDTMTHIHLHDHGEMHHLHKHSETVSEPHIHNHTHLEQIHGAVFSLRVK